MSIYLGVDIGTSGVRTVAFSLNCNIIAEGRAKIDRYYSKSGYIEQNPQEWLNATILSMQQVAMKLGSEINSIKGIGLTGQCPSFTLLYANGEILDKGFLYSDNRAKEETEYLVNRFGREEIHKRTGQNPSSFYILPKLLWLKKNKPEYLLPGATVLQPRDYIGWFLTGSLGTDPTHAACTLAYDLCEERWIEEWIFDLELNHLKWPKILPSCSILEGLNKKAADLIGLPHNIAVSVGGADSLCAVFGSSSTEYGDLCDISGSTTCLHLTVPEPISNLSVNTYPHVVNGLWCVEVGLNTTGIAFTWLSNLLGESYESLINAAKQVPPGADGLFFFPYLSGGERNMSNMPGAFIGLKLEHSKGHLARAMLEGITLSLKQRIDMIKSTGNNIKNISISGGGSKNSLWNGLKADILFLPVDTHPLVDTTAFGAARTVANALGEDIVIKEKTKKNRLYPDKVRNEIYENIYNQFCELENHYT